MESTLPIIDWYNTRLKRGWISEANFLVRRLYFRLFRERHLPTSDGIPPEGEIIDAGCFTGSKIGALIRRYPDRIIRGIDINSNALDIAQQRYASERVGFAQGNILSLQTKVRDAAMIFSSQVFHHLEKPERLIALDAIYQSLQTSGKFVISDTFLDLKKLVYRRLVAGYQKIAKCPYAVVMPTDIIEEAQSVGFGLVRIHDTLPWKTLWKKLWMYPSSMLTFVK